MKIFAIGMNYALHNKALHGTLSKPEEPVIFLKADTALLKDHKPFFIPDHMGRIEYEAEVVVRICRLGKNIPERFAHRYYDAYTIGIGYLGTNTPIDRCYECGFEGDFEPTEEGFKCPECGNSDPDRCNVTKRTCGYLGNPVQRPMVHGRHEEIAHRVKHMSGETGHVTLDDGSEREWFEETK